jgi:hypothetical protein
MVHGSYAKITPPLKRLEGLINFAHRPRYT